MKVSLDCSQGSQDRAIAVLVFSVVLSKAQDYLFLKKCGKK